MSEHIFGVGRGQIIDSVITHRLTELLTDPFLVLQVAAYTDFDAVRPVSAYMDDSRRDTDYDLGRIRHFRDRILAGKAVLPIIVDNRWSGCHPAELTLEDGHHRLCGAILAKARHIRVEYSGEIEALRWLKGERRTKPEWLNS